jgi:hypothetical protein
MKKHLRLFIFFILAFLLSSCAQWAVTPCMELSRLTPEVDPMTDEEQAALLASLDPAVQEVLGVYPLFEGNTWVYEYLGFDERMEVQWHVTEKVVDARIVDGHYLAEIERTASCNTEDLPDEFLNAPETGIFWYLVDGHDLYRLEDEETDLSDAWLEMVFPFREDEGWYPNPELRGEEVPDLFGYRKASRPYQEVLPIGGTYTCYNISTNREDAHNRQTFCETIGILYKEFIRIDQNSGYRVELVGVSIQ